MGAPELANVSISIFLKIQGPPDEPSLTLKVDDSNETIAQQSDTLVEVRAGQSVKLTCTSRGGNPDPTVTILKNGQTFGYGPSTFQTFKKFIATPSENNANFSCLSQNQVEQVHGVGTFKLNVLCKYSACSHAYNQG